MVRFARGFRLVVGGAVFAAFLIGASLLQSAETLAGFATSPGPHGLVSTCAGKHLGEVVIAP